MITVFPLNTQQEDTNPDLVLATQRRTLALGYSFPSRQSIHDNDMTDEPRGKNEIRVTSDHYFSCPDSQTAEESEKDVRVTSDSHFFCSDSQTVEQIKRRSESLLP